VTASGNALGQTPADTDTATATVTAVPCGGGCTTGFWQGGLGVTLWDEADDDDWGDAGGTGSNPFVTTDLFGAGIFLVPAAPNDFLGTKTMLEIVGTGGTNNWARKAARDAIAAYLNASFGMGYPFSAATVQADWDAAALLNTTAAYQAFHAKYAPANELGCTIGTPAPAGILIPLLPVSVTGVLAYLRRRAARG
jgi:hypothetical protein